MDYKEYLLNQSAINLQYIAESMWPTNKNAKSYLSTKLNNKDPKRPWTASDNEKAGIAIHELGLKLIKDGVSGGDPQEAASKPKETIVKTDAGTKKINDGEPTKAELLKKMLRSG